MDDDLLARCRDRGFTPGVRDVDPLLEQWEEHHRRASGPKGARQLTKVVVRALSRGEGGVARALLRGWSAAESEQRVLRLRVLGRLGGRMKIPGLAERLAAALGDAEPRVVREAARVLGKQPELASPTLVDALMTIAEDAALPERRATVEALGRVAGPDLLPRLRALSSDDEELARRIAEAVTLAARRADRVEAGAIALDRALPGLVDVVLRCRAGAAEVVAEQARAQLSVGSGEVERRGDDAVALRWSGPLRDLYRVRSATEVALSFPLPDGEALVDRIVAGLRRPELEAALSTWTEGAPRFRLSFGAGGRRRALVWEVARRLEAEGSALRNDSRDVAWSVQVDEAGRRLSCSPRGADPRFDYRRLDVPAATHPTLAALMAWLGRPRAGEVVWDPFCGSGAELVEAAVLAPGLHLRGTDVSEPAIEAARANLAAASIETASVELWRASALTVTPSHETTPVSLVLTNPPMGRRVVVEEQGVRRLLRDFVSHVARVLAPGGRMIWLSPAPRASAEWGRRVGLVAEDVCRIDMGGFFTTVQALRKPG